MQLTAHCNFYVIIGDTEKGASKWSGYDFIRAHSFFVLLRNV